jgi:hypothetical protein
MKEVAVTVDIYCNWEAVPEAYRVYVDDVLLTERTYHWRNTEQFVQENMLLNLEPGAHQFRLEPVNPEFRGFYTKNLTVDSVAADSVSNQFIIN